MSRVTLCTYPAGHAASPWTLRTTAGVFSLLMTSARTSATPSGPSPLAKAVAAWTGRPDVNQDRLPEHPLPRRHQRLRSPISSPGGRSLATRLARFCPDVVRRSPDGHASSSEHDTDDLEDAGAALNWHRPDGRPLIGRKWIEHARPITSVATRPIERGTAAPDVAGRLGARGRRRGLRATQGRDRCCLCCCSADSSSRPDRRNLLLRQHLRTFHPR